MRKILTLSFCLASMVVVFSCSKIDELLTPPIDILTGGSSKSWLLVNTKTNGKDDMEACYADDVTTFTKATSKALNEVGAKKCNSLDANSTSDFKLSDDGKTLTIDGIPSTVTKLTATELEFKTSLFGDTGEFFFKAK
jgi:hypothetical protein